MRPTLFGPLVVAATLCFGTLSPIGSTAFALDIGSTALALDAGASASTGASTGIDTRPDASARIRTLESLGRAQPFVAAKALEALLPDTPEQSTLRLELLTVQGLMLAVAAPPEAVEPTATRLEAWGRDPLAKNATAAAAAALLVRARSVARDGNLQRADATMREAFAKLPADAPPLDRYRFVSTHGYILDRTGQLEEAVRLNHEALALADAHGQGWQQSEARTELAYAYFGAKQLERASSLSQEAIALAQKVDDPVALGRAHNTAGIVLDGLGDQPGELRSFQAAIAAAQRAGAKTDEVRYVANVADFFLKNGDFKTALANAERALPLAREVKDPNSIEVSFANIGLAHISLQHIELGKRFVLEAIEMDEKRGQITSVADSWRELGGYLEKAGDVPSAVDAYHRHRRLATTLLRDDQQKAILAVQEQYDADNRSRALVLLNRENDTRPSNCAGAIFSSACGGCWLRPSCSRSQWSRCSTAVCARPTGC